MKTIRIVVEYDGTAYAGWQIQPNGLTVQEVVEKALAELTGERIRLHSSGRTDAGVHARGMSVHFRTERDLPLAAYREGVNRLLPPDIAIREAVEVPEGFHARFDATGKWYRYTICQGDVRSPLHRLTSWHIRTPLDLDAMKRGASAFVGEHDFAAFRSSSCEARSTVRTIFSVNIEKDGPLLFIDVKGSGFLKNMVRVMVGTLVELGLGKRLPEDLPSLFESGQRSASGKTAPPQGLCLMEVWYDDPPALS